MTFTEQLRAGQQAIWEKICNHPFVQGLGDGTLPRDRFLYYLWQDHLFLIEYSRVLALLTARAGSQELMRRLAGLLSATLTGEMEMQRGLAAAHGLQPEALGEGEAAPTTHAYSRHLLVLAALGSRVEIMASLAPCQQGYAELGQRLASAQPPGNPYADWIAAYASSDFAEVARWLCAATDEVARSSGGAECAAAARAHALSTRYEWMFWEMAWRGETWPV